MKPQQQNTDVKGHSSVFVQKPDGEQINIPSGSAREAAKRPEADADQTAKHTPTTHSKEVTDGEDA